MITMPAVPIGLSVIISDKVYAADSLASSIVNMARTDEMDGSIRTAGQLTELDPHASHFSSYIDGLAHVETHSGAGQTTFVRAGLSLYRHQGWTRSYESIRTGLTFDVNQPYPDTMVSINGQVYWCNGTDTPLILDAQRTSGRMIEPLGFDRSPSQPSILCPTPAGYDSTPRGTPVPPNTIGYSVPGRIGTLSPVSGEDGSMLDGQWVYYLQWEDGYGNLSPLSPASVPAILQQQSTGYVHPFNGDYKRMNRLDMMTRQFCVRSLDTGESHVRAIRLYRTKDTMHSPDGGTPYLLARLEGRESFTYPDNIPDSRLAFGTEASTPVPVMPYRVACEHNGRLVIANFSGNPGKLMWSEPGFYGTFLSGNDRIPDPTGAEITGLASHQGFLYAFTHTGFYRISIQADSVDVQPMSTAVGCAAPQSIQTLPDGTLLWLSLTGWVRLTGNGLDDSPSKGIRRSITSRISRSRAGRAVSAIDPATGIYLCALSLEGDTTNDTIVAFDYKTGGFTTFDQSVGISAMAPCPGRNHHLLLAGLVPGSNPTVYVWNKRTPQTVILPTSSWTSALLRIDPLGIKRFNVSEIHLVFIESQGTPITDVPPAYITWYAGDRANAPATTERIDLRGEDYPDAEILSQNLLDSGTIFQRPNLRVRKIVTKSATNLHGFWFSINAPQGLPMHLAQVALVVQEVGINGSRSPTTVR